MKKVYWIRHGQSEGNVIQKHYGMWPVPLTEKGIADAAAAGQRLKNISFTKVYSSDMKRAVQTAQIALPGYDLILDERLREIEVGDLAGYTMKECEGKYGAEYLRNFKVHNFLDYGGENHAMHYARLSDFMRDLETEDDDAVIAVFSHGGTMRCMLEYVLHTQGGLPVRFKNGGVIMSEYEDNQWFLHIL